jgi:hypothetical protein
MGPGEMIHEKNTLRRKCRGRLHLSSYLIDQHSERQIKLVHFQTSLVEKFTASRIFNRGIQYELYCVDFREFSIKNCTCIHLEGLYSLPARIFSFAVHKVREYA